MCLTYIRLTIAILKQWQLLLETKLAKYFFSLLFFFKHDSIIQVKFIIWVNHLDQNSRRHTSYSVVKAKLACKAGSIKQYITSTVRWCCYHQDLKLFKLKKKLRNYLLILVIVIWVLLHQYVSFNKKTFILNVFVW